MTITLPAAMAAMLKAELAGGDHTSASEIVRGALRDWEARTEMRRRRLETLRADIAAETGSAPALPGEEVIERLLQRCPAQAG